MGRINCEHPDNKRWQYVGFWLCCKCGYYFWGQTEELDTVIDIYGRKVEENGSN